MTDGATHESSTTGDAMSQLRLDGKVAVITGAASGIGAATAELFATAGARIVGGDINDEGLAATTARVEAQGGRCVTRRCDVTSRADVAALVDAALAEFGQVDVMCNIAGTMFPGKIEDLTDEQFDAGVDLNLKGVLYGCQEAVRAMKDRRTGSIINVSSGAIDRPYPGIGLYALTKAAVTMLSMTLAIEAGEYGIRVNAIAPGATVTPFTTWRLYDADGNLDQAAYDAFIEQMKAMSPLGITGDPIDQAYMMLYLASDAARYVTGGIHRANGGQTMVW